LGRPIFDARDDKIAAIKDVIVRYGEEDYPPVIGIVARYQRRLFFISNRDIFDLNENGAKMRTPVLDLNPFTRRTEKCFLAKTFLTTN
jgi:uncharacterized protein (UPF0262 family)